MPPEEFISGVCTAGWFRYLEGLITMHGAALAAVLFLGVSVWLAPSHKKVVTGVVFIGGCAVALYLAWLTAAWDSFLAAVTAGAVTFVFPLRTLNGPPRLSCPIDPASPT